ncbi:hypothetical protein [Serratia silvae]|uniref:Uncharacterized protein n=1 Tax=Serratia silvae TaxID=2824122 RepID=A0ABT0KIF6_9GAMM|nr:hypothetical protein [Serratia silvae]MCL1031826.1 hypothetical protein [Serratia silvae]
MRISNAFNLFRANVLNDTKAAVALAQKKPEKYNDVAMKLTKASITSLNFKLENKESKLADADKKLEAGKNKYPREYEYAHSKDARMVGKSYEAVKSHNKNMSVYSDNIAPHARVCNELREEISSLKSKIENHEGNLKHMVHAGNVKNIQKATIY